MKKTKIHSLEKWINSRVGWGIVAAGLSVGAASLVLLLRVPLPAWFLCSHFFPVRDLPVYVDALPVIVLGSLILTPLLLFLGNLLLIEPQPLAPSDPAALPELLKLESSSPNHLIEFIKTCKGIELYDCLEDLDGRTICPLQKPGEKSAS